MVYDTLMHLLLFGPPNSEPWFGQNVKFICPVPGYDRHFRILEHFGLLQYFDFVSGSCMDETRTQKWEVIQWALEQCCDDSSRVLMVGDRKHDVQGAKRFGLPCLGVLYGYGGREELEKAGADAFAASPEEIGDYILH